MELPRLKSGMTRLDTMISSLFNPGNLILLEGAPTSYIDLFAKQIACGGNSVSAPQSVLFFSTYETKQEILETIAHRSLLEDEKRYLQLDIRTIESKRLREAVDGLFGDLNTESNILPNLIVVDSLNGILDAEHIDIQNISADRFKPFYDRISDLKNLLRQDASSDRETQYGRVALFTLYEGMYPEVVKAWMEQLCDIVIEMKTVQKREEKVEYLSSVHTLVLKKVRNFPEQILTPEIPLEITQNGFISSVLKGRVS